MEYTIGMVGAGGIARAHLAAWTALGMPVLVYSDDAGAEALTTGNPRAEAVASMEELLDRCDLVDVCTPTDTHKMIAIAAMRHGHSVICEKPLALTYSDAAEMRAVAEKTGTRLLPGHVVRYFGPYWRMRQAVNARAAGDVALTRFTRIGQAPSWSPWFADETRSGGIIVDQMVHDIDIARWVCGAVARVHARRSTRSSESGVATGQVVLEHVNGAVSNLIGVWAPPGTPFRTSFEIRGTDGVLTYDSADPGAVTVHGTGGLDNGIPLGGPGEDPFRTELADMLSAITRGTKPRVNVHDGVEAVRLAELARHAAGTGATLDVAPIETGA
jgi:predicted dehydrogenase